MNTNLPVEYRLSLPSEWDDVVDFANFVFSQAHRPHDFKTLLPKVYADGAPEIARHFVAVRGGRIRAMVADCLQELRVGDRTLRAGMVGTVSVHPYSRGEGHMKKLMAMMIDDAQQSGLDLLILGGQRQRYGYFGFDNFGCTPHYTLTDASVRHGCAGVDASGISFSELTEEKPGAVDFAWALSQREISAGVRLRAEFLLSVVVFFILLVGFFVIGQPYGLLLALVLAVMDFIPIIGAGTVMVPWAVVDLFMGNYFHAVQLMVIWGAIALFRRVGEPKFVGDQTGLSPIASLISIYIGWRLAGVLGMILGPTIALIALNLVRLGIFEGVRLDLAAAAEDIMAVLRERPPRKEE